ncbi:MAG TPA: acyl carrier protein [Actinocrinis sp.]|jgi:acyl carrier protein
MPTDELVADVLAQLLEADPDALTAETDLSAVEGWDSVNALRVLMFLERELGSALDFERYSAAATVGDLVAVADAARGQEARP